MKIAIHDGRGISPAPFPGPRRRGRCVPGGIGREKHYPDPVWKQRVARLGGRNIFGEPCFDVVWGWTVTRIGAVPRFVQGLNKWLLLRWFPAETWGERPMWYAPQLDGNTWAPSYAEEFHEDYPYRGGYEIDFAFDEGKEFCLPFVVSRIAAHGRRSEIEPLSVRRRRDVEALGADEREKWQRDYDRFVEASRAFGDAPMVGYGAKAATVRGTAPTMCDAAYQKLKHVHAGRVARLERLARESSA
jgi:hypothetical protein